MRKIVMMVALAVLLIPLGAGLAFASDQIIQCRTNPCFGAGNNDLVYERIGNGKNDTIVLKGGNDKVLANAYRSDTDVVKGGTGFDKINVADGDVRDKAGDKSRRNWCIVDARSELTRGCSRVTVQ